MFDLHRRTSVATRPPGTGGLDPALAGQGPHPGRQRSVPRLLGHGLLVAATFVLIAAASIAFGLRVTPLRSVSALGQTVAVGATPPTLSLSGPGEVDLFGQPLPTKVMFIGPVRPRLVLTNITINQQLAGLFEPGGGSAAALGDQLASGWTHYFATEIAFVAMGALLLLGVVAGWRRHAWSWRRTAATIVGGLVLVEALNVGVIMLTAYTAPSRFRNVHSLGELVGQSEQAPIAAAPGPSLPGVQAVVLGDSTAAGLGEPPPPDANANDLACGRSIDAYAVHLADVNRWRVENLACGGATIRDGILGPQRVGDRTIPPQLAVAKKAIAASAVIVSVGANDLQWGPMIRLCAVSDRCDDRASTVYFQRSLALFTRDYYELLRQLAALPDDPRVVINLYYGPFDTSADCLSGLTPPKLGVLLDRLDALNAVLAQGAKTFGYLAAMPDFGGHGLCAGQSYVQGLEDPAPFHPNARGQLVIALADERALLGAA